MQPLLSFIEQLETRLETDPPKQKGDRTRERLKIATAKMLEKKGYHAMRVSDVSECAKVAEGSFYIYFHDKTDATVRVLTELLENFSNIEVKPETRKTVFDSIRSTNLRWISMCRANAGLMRCILQLGDEEPEFARLSQRSNRIWAERVALSATKRRAGLKAEPARLAAYMLGAMMDEIVRKLVIYPDPEFLRLLAALDADDEALADAVSLVWYRVFHPDATRPADLSSAGTTLAEWMMPGSDTVRVAKAS